MSTDIDELMDRDPNDASDTDIDEIIAWFRKQRADKLENPKKSKDKPEIDLSIFGVVEPEVKVTRRQLK